MMKKMNRNAWKKGVSIAAVLAMMAGTLAGCGGKAQSAAETTAAAKAAEAASVAAADPASESKASGTIDFYYWDSSQTDGVNAVIELFKEKNPDITVIATQIPSSEYWTKLQTALPTGTGPDVFWMNINCSDYVEAGLLYDMTQRIEEEGIDMSMYPEFVTNLYSYDGHHYGIPKDYDGIGLFYNKEIFDEMGVEYPTDAMSWEELLELAKKVTTDEHYGFIANTSGNSCYQNFIYSNGGRISSADGKGCEINEAPVVEALQYLHDMMYVHKVAPTYAELQEMKANSMFSVGKAAMITAGSWSISTFIDALGDNVGVCTMPVAKVPAITANGLGYSISSKTDNLEASWEFVKFLATEEAQAATASGAIPAYKGCDKIWADQYAQYDAEKLLGGIYYEGSLGNPVWYGKRVEGMEVVTTAITNIYADENADIQAILDQCDADVEAITNQ